MTGVHVPGTPKARPNLPHGPCGAEPGRPDRAGPGPASQPAPVRAPGPAQGRCHRCARRSPESAPREGAGPPASGGVTGAREDQWRVCTAPPRASDWPAPAGRGRGPGRPAAAGLSLGRPRRASCSLLHSSLSPGPPSPPWPSE